MTHSGITVVICSVGKPRMELLTRAMRSAQSQTLEPDAIVVSIDTRRQGAAWNRQRGFELVNTELVAFLDDDDELKPEHLQRLHDHLELTGADLVYPWFDVIGGTDPFPMHFGKEFDPVSPRLFPITYLARTDKIRAAGGWAPQGFTPETMNRSGEDWALELNLIEIGAKIVHLPERTWFWYHNSGNTSGMAGRVHWDA